MERLSQQAPEQFCREATLAQRKPQLLFVPTPVQRIPHDGVTEVREMHPDLMRATGFETDLEPRRGKLGTSEGLGGRVG